MTTEQISNSNIVGLAATLVVRIVAGPLVDTFGPRKVMASLLVLGAIPSGLVPIVHSVGGLYTARFFVGILGGTFVPCQAWMTAFVDTSIVGRASALSGGWGNTGGGVTFATQTGLFQRLVKDGMKPHLAWRVCFVVLPVPLLLLTALGMMLFGQDHPLGKWSMRHSSSAAAETVIVAPEPHTPVRTDCDKREHTPAQLLVQSSKEKRAVEVKEIKYVIPVDVAVNEPFSLRTMGAVMADSRTWMLALSYGSTFGFELAMDSGLANSLYALYKGPDFKQLDAGYLACTYGLLNICFRFTGGLCSDLLYRRFGVTAKKWLLLVCATLQGCMALGLGLLIDYGEHSKGNVMGLVVLCALFGFMANGANYALVPHIASRSNGLMSGIVGATGNAGGIVYALIWRFQAAKSSGRPFWISGILCTSLNLLLMLIPLEDAA